MNHIFLISIFLPGLLAIPLGTKIVSLSEKNESDSEQTPPITFEGFNCSVDFELEATESSDNIDTAVQPVKCPLNLKSKAEKELYIKEKHKAIKPYSKADGIRNIHPILLASLTGKKKFGNSDGDNSTLDENDGRLKYDFNNDVSYDDDDDSGVMVTFHGFLLLCPLLTMLYKQFVI